jgi:hypothetical protein
VRVRPHTAGAAAIKPLRSQTRGRSCSVAGPATAPYPNLVDVEPGRGTAECRLKPGRSGAGVKEVEQEQWLRYVAGITNPSRLVHVSFHDAAR